ncbi:MAG: putative methyltransferase [Bermanella sp.]|jgi:predicted methyltransferase
MANTYAVYSSGQVVLEYWCGDIYFDELMKHQLKQKSDARITSQSSEIVDFRDVNTCLTDMEIVKFSETLANNNLIKKIALITHIKDWEQATLFSKKAWYLDVEVIIFHTVEAACAWVGFDSKNIDKKLNQLKLGLIAESEA